MSPVAPTQSGRESDDYVPGTVHLIDLEGTLLVKKDQGHLNIILQPQPSLNPNDPLRWSKGKKLAQFSMVWIWAFFLAITVNWTGPYWTEWTTEFDCTFTQLNVTLALCFLFLGVGCLVLQPTAMKIGRRPVYLMCTVIGLVANVIGRQATNINYLYVSNILGGFAAAPVDSLVGISSTDVFFIHERASKMSWLILALYFGSDIGPVVAGYLPLWRWGFTIQIIVFAVMFIIQLFYMEDTIFADRDGSTEENILEQIRSHEDAMDMKPAAVNTVMPHDEKAGAVTTVHDEASDSDDALLVDHSIPLRTYWQRMRLWELEYNDKRSWLTIFYRPFVLVTFPGVLWGGLIYGAQMMWLSLLATTQSEIYTGIYGFSDGSTGLTNLAPLVGSFIGMIYGGAFVDWLAIKLALRNDGILEPEFRVWAMVLPTVLNAAGLLAYGLPGESHASWAISVVLGQGLLGFSMSSSGPICLTYAIDSYPELASEALVLILFLRNMIATGFTFAIQPWLDRNGLTLTTWLMFMLSLVINGSFVGILIWGKAFRRWTKSWYYRYKDPMFGELFRK